LQTNWTGTRVFYENIKSKHTVLLNRGGARSTKSYSIIQILTLKWANEQKKKILVLRKTLPSLRVSTLPVFIQMWVDSGLQRKIRAEKQDLNFWLGDNLIHFGSLGVSEAGVERIKSTDWNYIFLEEANEFTIEDYRILKLRLSAPSLDGQKNRMYLSFNPISSYHWLKLELADKAVSEDVDEIVSTYRDNPFLSPDYIKIIESLKEQNLNFYNIYSEGQWGVLEEIIYDKVWTQVDSLPETGDFCFSCDFGYNAHTAVVKIAFKDDNPYIQQMLYQTKLTNSELIQQLKILIPENERGCDIFADASEPDRIREICDSGFNCKPADKSVKDGIDYIKSLNVYVTKSSPDVIKEKNSYSYMKDKDGHVIDQPVKFQDHLLDAIRYALWTRHVIRDPRIRWLTG